MSFLGRDRITEELDNLFLKGTYDASCVQQASYDLRLGSEAYVVGADTPVRLSKEKNEYLNIAPGQFALLLSLEELTMPDSFIGFISLRNTFKMQGLINISGFHVDPSFRGRLVFAVNNVGPSDIRLRFEERTFTITFSHVEGGIGEPRPPAANRLPLEYVQNLGGGSVTLSKLQKDLDDLKTKFLVYVPLAVGLIISLLLALLHH